MILLIDPLTDSQSIFFFKHFPLIQYNHVYLIRLLLIIVEIEGPIASVEEMTHFDTFLKIKQKYQNRIRL